MVKTGDFQSMNVKQLKKIAVDQGLRFECVPGCIKCCAIPGLVFVHEREIPAMAEFFSLTPEQFIRKKLRRHFGRIYQLDMPTSEPCAYLSENGCSIYPVRPAQCSAFPFWPENVADPQTWKKLGEFCPGIGRGRMFSIDEVSDIMGTVSYGPFL